MLHRLKQKHNSAFLLAAFAALGALALTVEPTLAETATHCEGENCGHSSFQTAQFLLTPVHSMLQDLNPPAPSYTPVNGAPIVVSFDCSTHQLPVGGQPGTSDFLAVEVFDAQDNLIGATSRTVPEAACTTGQWMVMPQIWPQSWGQPAYVVVTNAGYDAFKYSGIALDQGNAAWELNFFSSSFSCVSSDPGDGACLPCMVFEMSSNRWQAC